jgi:4'-phosphopantetheinyl transferase EntD
MSNPACDSAALGELFPFGAHAAVLREPGDPNLLYPAERPYLGRAVLQRAQEFAGGRLCARRALAALGIEEFPVHRGEDRAPLWPAGIVGSIAHTAGFCVAVAARTLHLKSVGIDCEIIGRVKPDLWRRICTAAEMSWLASLEESERGLASTLIFSAKEAFYKCQYPLTREFLSFEDAHVIVAGWDGAGGRFEVHATRDIALRGLVDLPLRGRFVRDHECVVTGVAVSAA